MSEIPSEKDYQDLSFLNFVASDMWEEEIIKSERELDDGLNLLGTILNNNGAPNLTVCPECHVDDFTHVEGCKLGEKCRKQASEYSIQRVEERQRKRIREHPEIVKGQVFIKFKNNLKFVVNEVNGDQIYFHEQHYMCQKIMGRDEFLKMFYLEPSPEENNVN